MPKAPELDFSPKARADIGDIYDFTELTWGPEQADRYTIEMKMACARLAMNPGMGRKADAIRPGYRVMGCGSHNIFYRHEGGRILVVRILHRRMDPVRHLG